MDTATEQGPTRLRAARDDSGDNLDDAAQAVKARLGRTCSRETIRRYEKGLVTEDAWDVEIVAVLAERWGKKIRDLSPTVATRAATLKEILITSRDAASGKSRGAV